MDVTLAIDYGSARVGTAASGGWMARRLEVLPHGSLPSLINRLLKLAREERATQFLVGLPVHADGSEGDQAAAARAFAQELANSTPLPVLLWDEYGSSKTAQQHMIGAKTRRKARRKKKDAIAAAIFLQEYIENREKEAERVLPKQ